MQYNDFTTADFVADTFFQQWVLAPNQMSDTFWKNWQEEHPEQCIEIERAIQLIQGVKFKTHYPSGQEFHQVWQEIVTNRSGGHYKVKQSASTEYRWYVAASFLLLGLVSLWWIQMPTHSPFVVAYQTEYGEKQEVTLPDGSSVILGANSQLYYPRIWDKKEPRRVTLEGEAYFSITHQVNDQKFIVRSAEVEIEVLGTKFNVNNRRGENRVLLEEGSIRLDVSRVDPLSPKPPRILMEPGEIVEIDDQRIVKKAVNPTPYVSWTQDVLIFDRTTLREVIRVIEDRYGYTIITRELAIDELVFTAELRTTDVNIILQYLSEVFNLTITRNDNKITLTPRQ